MRWESKLLHCETFFSELDVRCVGKEGMKEKNEAGTSFVA